MEIFRRQTEILEHFLMRNAFATVLAQPLFGLLHSTPFLFGLWLIVDGCRRQLP